MNHEQIIQTIRTDSQLRWHVIADSTANAQTAYEKAHGKVDGKVDSETFAEAASTYRSDYRAGNA